MSHHKRAVCPKPPSPPYCALSILLLHHAHVLGRVLLHKELLSKSCKEMLELSIFILNTFQYEHVNNH